jgi:hypothetical protein
MGGFFCSVFLQLLELNLVEIGGPDRMGRVSNRRESGVGAWLDHEFDRRPDLILDVDICEFGDTGYKNAIILEVGRRQDKSFYRLVDRSSANRLHFCPVMFADDPCNCTGNRRGT